MPSETTAHHPSTCTCWSSLSPWPLSHSCSPGPRSIAQNSDSRVRQRSNTHLLSSLALFQGRQLLGLMMSSNILMSYLLKIVPSRLKQLTAVAQWPWLALSSRARNSQSCGAVRSGGRWSSLARRSALLTESPTSRQEKSSPSSTSSRGGQLRLVARTGVDLGEKACLLVLFWTDSLNYFSQFQSRRLRQDSTAFTRSSSLWLLRVWTLRLFSAWDSCSCRACTSSLLRLSSCLASAHSRSACDSLASTSRLALWTCCSLVWVSAQRSCFMDLSSALSSLTQASSYLIFVYLTSCCNCRLAAVRLYIYLRCCSTRSRNSECSSSSRTSLVLPLLAFCSLAFALPSSAESALTSSLSFSFSQQSASLSKMIRRGIFRSKSPRRACPVPASLPAALLARAVVGLINNNKSLPPYIVLRGLARKDLPLQLQLRALLGHRLLGHSLQDPPVLQALQGPQSPLGHPLQAPLYKVYEVGVCSGQYFFERPRAGLANFPLAVADPESLGVEVPVAAFGGGDELPGRTAEHLREEEDLLGLVGAGEDGLAGVQFCQEEGERPHVYFQGVGVAEDHLGGAVVAGLDVVVHDVGDEAARAEVDDAQAGPPGLPEQHVLWLDVAVDDALAAEEGQPLQQLDREPAHHVVGQGLVPVQPDHLVQVEAHQLEHEADVAPPEEVVPHHHHVVLLPLLRDVRQDLLLHPRLPRTLLLRAHHLQRRPLLLPVVEHLHHPSERPAPQLLPQLVPEPHLVALLAPEVALLVVFGPLLPPLTPLSQVPHVPQPLQLLLFLRREQMRPLLQRLRPLQRVGWGSALRLRLLARALSLLAEKARPYRLHLVLHRVVPGRGLLLRLLSEPTALAGQEETAPALLGERQRSFDPFKLVRQLLLLLQGGDRVEVEGGSVLGDDPGSQTGVPVRRTLSPAPVLVRRHASIKSRHSSAQSRNPSVSLLDCTTCRLLIFLNQGGAILYLSRRAASLPTSYVGSLQMTTRRKSPPLKMLPGRTSAFCSSNSRTLTSSMSANRYLLRSTHRVAQMDPAEGPQTTPSRPLTRSLRVSVQSWTFAIMSSRLASFSGSSMTSRSLLWTTVLGIMNTLAQLRMPLRTSSKVPGLPQTSSQPIRQPGTQYFLVRPEHRKMGTSPERLAKDCQSLLNTMSSQISSATRTNSLFLHSLSTFILHSTDSTLPVGLEGSLTRRKRVRQSISASTLAVSISKPGSSRGQQRHQTPNAWATRAMKGKPGRGSKILSPSSVRVSRLSTSVMDPPKERVTSSGSSLKKGVEQTLARYSLDSRMP